MSEHAWVQEHIAAHVSGGLDAGEAERVEAHVRECPACEAALKDARALDRNLDSLFAAAQPGPALEDRLIRALRQPVSPRSLRSGWQRKLAIGIAASVGLGLTGAGMSYLAGEVGLPFPGRVRDKALALVQVNTASASLDEGARGIQERLRTSGLAAGPTTDAYASEQSKQLELGEVSRKRSGQWQSPARDPEAMARDFSERSKNPVLMTDGTANSVFSLEAETRASLLGKSQLDDSGSSKSGNGQWRDQAPAGGPGRPMSPQMGYAPGGGFGPMGGGGPMGPMSGGPGFPAQGGFGGQGGQGGFGGGGLGGGVGGFGGIGGIGGTPGSGAGSGAFYRTPPMQNTPDDSSKAKFSLPTNSTATGISASPGTSPPPIDMLGMRAKEGWGAENKGNEKGLKDLDSLQQKSGGSSTLPHFNPTEYKNKILAATEGGKDPKVADLPEAPKPIPPAKQDPNSATYGIWNAANSMTISPKSPPDAEPVAPARKIIRTGEIEFEIESFDSATASIIKLVNAIKGGFIGTINSDKLANGKVKGSIVVRVPPEALDGLVLDLRRDLGKGGELKGQRIASQDITKQFTDTESRLKAARTMEERLLRIIKEGKGEIKQLLEAERELGVWRTKIEEMEGELRYFSNQVQLSTLTITLAEKEIKSAAALTETEVVQAGIEVEDVDKAWQAVLAAVAEAKGRITKSELKQLAAGQFNATLNFEVPPPQSGPLRDRLRQLGRMARLEIDRKQQAEGGTPLKDSKVTRGDTQFFVQLYNLANIEPRETGTLKVAAPDVPAAYAALQDAVGKVKARVLVSKLDEHDKQNMNGQLDFEIRRADEGTIQLALAKAGDAIARNVARAPESDAVTDSKIRYRVTILSASSLVPKETTTLNLAVPDVPTAFTVLQEAIGLAKGRVVTAKLNEQDRRNVNAELDFEVRRADEAAIKNALSAAGDIVTRDVSRAPDAETVTDAKVRFRMTLFSAANLVPKETTSLGIEVENVDATATILTAKVNEAKGRVVESNVSHLRSGQVSARLIYDVPLAAAPGLIEQFKKVGKFRAEQSANNPHAADGKLALARIDISLANGELIVSNDEGVWPQIRKGLSWSVNVLLLSLSWLIVGLCVVLPWGLVGYGGYRIVRKLIPSSPDSPPSPAPTPAA